MRDRNPSNGDNWKVVCSDCGAEFLPTEVIDLVAGHFQEEHPDLDKPHLNVIWVGIGPKPKAGGITSGRMTRRRR